MPAPVATLLESQDVLQELQRGVDLLNAGGIVILPTETVYGAAGRLDLPQARARLNALRGNDDHPMTIHVARPQDALAYLGEVTELGHRLMRKLWPGPVGLVFDVPPARQAEVCASFNLAIGDLYQSGQITLRCPDHLVASNLLGMVKGPVALTIASGGTGTGFNAQSFADDLGDKVDLIFDAGPTRFSKPSTLVHVQANKFTIQRVGVYDERIIDRLLKTTILFVCSGNTCRSPMAEAIARDTLIRFAGGDEDQLSRLGVAVMSAGTFAMPNARATPAAVEALKDLHIDLSRHRSRPLSVELIHQADAIYTMGRSHAQTVRALVPAAAEKTFTLDPDGDIEDPIGSDVTVYRKLTEKLKALIETRLKADFAEYMVEKSLEK